jgi:hypothetical protein
LAHGVGDGPIPHGSAVDEEVLQVRLGAGYRRQPEPAPDAQAGRVFRDGQAGGSQLAAVTAFLQPLEIVWQGSLGKDICVFYYPDCEVVYYDARAAERRVCCVEFEALGSSSLEAARATLAAYEQRLGLGQARRVQESLFDLLLLPAMPT